MPRRQWDDEEPTRRPPRGERRHNRQVQRALKGVSDFGHNVFEAAQEVASHVVSELTPTREDAQAPSPSPDSAQAGQEEKEPIVTQNAQPQQNVHSLEEIVALALQEHKELTQKVDGLTEEIQALKRTLDQHDRRLTNEVNLVARELFPQVVPALMQLIAPHMAQQTPAQPQNPQGTRDRQAQANAPAQQPDSATDQTVAPTPPAPEQPQRPLTALEMFQQRQNAGQ